MGAVERYVDDVLTGAIPACVELKLACGRYVNDRKDKRWTFKRKEAEAIVEIIEKTIVLVEGENAKGESLRKKPFKLLPWQKFIVYNLFGFYKRGTIIRRFEEALINVPKKNGKSPFAGALAWAFAYRHARSGSKVLLTSNSLRQSRFSFDFIKRNMYEMGIAEEFTIRDNNVEHSIEGEVNGGSIEIQAFAGNPENKDGFKANFVIADEIHEYKDPNQYIVFQKATKAYRNKLMFAITTAGDDPTSFCARRIETCKKILSGKLERPEYFVFITKADEDEKGRTDFLNPVEHMKANPSYGVTVMPEEIKRSAEMAQDEPQLLKSFLAKELNVYTNSVKAYFDLRVFRESNNKYNWTLEELAGLPVEWFGGADLSAVKDLTAAVLYGTYKGIDILITQAFFPITRARIKTEKENVPLYGWEQDGELTFCNSPTINYLDVVNWFVGMRKKGFKIREVRYDQRFSEEFVVDMNALRFTIKNQKQLYVETTKGFNRIDKAAEEGVFYYLGAESF
jgi:phage terminase large subunit-like protein